MRQILGVMIVLWSAAALAAPAQTGKWTNGCRSTGNAVTGIRGGDTACYTPAVGASTESATPMLSVASCENFDAFLYDDFDGDATVCTVTWAIQMCPIGADLLTTDALKNAACATLPGTVTLSGDDVESNFAGHLIRVVGQAAGSNIDSCRILVKCAIEGSK